MASIEAVLLDLDGVLHVDDVLLEGAVETLEELQRRQLPVRYLTNTSTRTPAQVEARLARMGLPVAPGQVFSAVEALRVWLQAQGIGRVAPLLADSVSCYLEDVCQLDEQTPEAVVIGDIGDRWSHSLLNRAFHWLLSGARLVCIHRNRYWQTGDTLSVDIGAYVAALEYAAGVRAEVVGKPERSFFAAACASLGQPPERVLMVGDDIDSDIGGGQGAGCIGVLVETGKYRAELVKNSPVIPACRIPSIAQLPTLLDRL